MTEYKLYFEISPGALPGGDVSTIERHSLVETWQEYTKRVVRNHIPEGAHCELWEKPRTQWRVVDGWVYRRELWT